MKHSLDVDINELTEMHETVREGELDLTCCNSIYLYFPNKCTAQKTCLHICIAFLRECSRRLLCRPLRFSFLSLLLFEAAERRTRARNY